MPHFPICCRRLDLNYIHSGPFFKLIFIFQISFKRAVEDDSVTRKYFDCQKANLLHNYFVEQSTVDDDNMILPDIPILNYPQIDDIIIKQNDVYQLLCNLDVNKATGNDQIGNKLLKVAAPSISQILSKIFNTSIQNGKYPQVWRNACVIPIYKKGSHSNIINYRPVSLLLCVSKIFEPYFKLPKITQQNSPVSFQAILAGTNFYTLLIKYIRS